MELNIFLPMELDHIFIFTQKHDRLADSLKAFGLSEGTPNTHSGQGTACRRFFFHNAYLELVWIANEEEARNSAFAKAKLWERSQYHFTNYCPFGLCFRTKSQPGKPFTLLFDDGWRYYSPFLPEGQFANIAPNESFATEPLLFEMPFFGIAPDDYPLGKQQILEHARGFEEVTSVSLTLPITTNSLSTAMKKVLRKSIVSVSEGEEYFVILELDGGRTEETQTFFPLAPLTLKW